MTVGSPAEAPSDFGRAPGSVYRDNPHIFTRVVPPLRQDGVTLRLASNYLTTYLSLVRVGFPIGVTVPKTLH